ncbi:MAG: DUF2183 domain-containing protein [Anaerolineae bacterium]|nr:DUF2183 domain-containing protein [Anaerolineae bacterium]
MANWKQALTHIVGSIDDYFDSLQFRRRQRRGVAPVQILAYIGHGTRETFYVRGRAIEDYSVLDARDTDTTWRNLRNMYRRFNSQEIPHARVRAYFNGKVYETRADDEGVFRVEITLDPPLLDGVIWHDVPVELIDYAEQESARTVARVIVPPSTARFGIISDLDDTVIKSDVVNLLKLARNTFLYNSHTRLPFAGVSEFYHALQRGVGQGSGATAEYNPFFYVSNSPWNLYDLLVDFFKVRGIPMGTFFLSDIGLTPTKLVRTNGVKQKSDVIHMLFETHPQLPFILIGDSGEQDAEIYFKVVQRYPGRVKAIYIRDVSLQRRDREVQQIIEQVAASGTEMLLIPDTAAAAAHALSRGYIAPAALPAIQEEKRADQQTTPIEAMFDDIS